MGARGADRSDAGCAVSPRLVDGGVSGAALLRHAAVGSRACVGGGGVRDL